MGYRRLRRCPSSTLNGAFDLLIGRLPRRIVARGPRGRGRHDRTFEGFAAARILVVAISVLGSLTVLPALLSKLGDRVNKGRVPFLRSPDQRVGESRVWGAILAPVLRRPLLSAVLAAGFLFLLAVPALRLETTQNSTQSYPRSLAVISTYDKIQKASPATPSARGFSLRPRMSARGWSGARSVS
jgi:hypothetical protein